MVNLRQRWDAILRAEGLGEIEFSETVVASSAAYHQARTDSARHFRAPEQMASLAEVLSEYRLPLTHRRVLRAFLRGQSLRQIADAFGISKDTAHRIVLRYLRNKALATMRDLTLPEMLVPLDARRARLARGTREHRRPLSSSDAAGMYFELGREFGREYAFQWHRDREIWDLHLAGRSRRRIAREIGAPHTTVQRALMRVRRSFRAWLAGRARPEQSDGDAIAAMFDTLSQHQRN